MSVHRPDSAPPQSPAWRHLDIEDSPPTTASRKRNLPNSEPNSPAPHRKKKKTAVSFFGRVKRFFWGSKPEEEEIESEIEEELQRIENEELYWNPMSTPVNRNGRSVNRTNTIDLTNNGSADDEVVCEESSSYPRRPETATSARRCRPQSQMCLRSSPPSALSKSIVVCQDESDCIEEDDDVQVVDEKSNSKEDKEDDIEVISSDSSNSSDDVQVISDRKENNDDVQVLLVRSPSAQKARTPTASAISQFVINGSSEDDDVVLLDDTKDEVPHHHNSSILSSSSEKKTERRHPNIYSPAQHEPFVLKKNGIAPKLRDRARPGVSSSLHTLHARNQQQSTRPSINIGGFIARTFGQSIENDNERDNAPMSMSLERYRDCVSKYGGVIVDYGSEIDKARARAKELDKSSKFKHRHRPSVDYRARVRKALLRSEKDEEEKEVQRETLMEREIQKRDIISEEFAVRLIQDSKQSSRDVTDAEDNRSVESYSRAISPCSVSSSSSFTTSSRASERYSDIVANFKNIALDRKNAGLRLEGYKRDYKSRTEKLSLLDEEVALRLQDRDRKQKNYLQDLRKRLELTGIHIPKPIIAKKVDEFPALPDEATILLQKAWNKNLNQMEKFVEAFDIPITRKDLITLGGLNWLNDEVINYFMNLIMQRNGGNDELPKVYAFNTFFYHNISTKGYVSVKRWTRKVDIFAHDILLVPVHLSVHWCMAVIDLSEKTIDYYDSLFGENQECLNHLKSYLQQESMDKKKIPFSFEGWTFNIRDDIPGQKNGSDCGMFACRFAEFASRRADIVFKQEHMPYFRKRMVWEICQKKLMN